MLPTIRKIPSYNQQNKQSTNVELSALKQLRQLASAAASLSLRRLLSMGNGQHCISKKTRLHLITSALSIISVRDLDHTFPKFFKIQICQKICRHPILISQFVSPSSPLPPNVKKLMKIQGTWNSLRMIPIDVSLAKLVNISNLSSFT